MRAVRHLVLVPAVTALAALRLPSARMLTFDTFDVNATDAALSGTERMIRSDLYAGQPCPTDPPSYRYTSLDIDPFYLDYVICHTFDSPW